MVYGETGLYPIAIDMKIRYTLYWLKLSQEPRTKLSSAFLKVLYKCEDVTWLREVKNTLDTCGLSYIFMTSGRGVNPVWLKEKLRLCLTDQYIQDWFARLDNAENLIFYKQLKGDYFCFEKYLTALPLVHRTAMCKFRCRNINIPLVNYVTFDYQSDPACLLCGHGIGDEMHYMFYCQTFSRCRVKLIPTYYRQYPTMEKLKLLFYTKGVHLINLCKYLDIVIRALSHRC